MSTQLGTAATQDSSAFATAAQGAEADAAVKSVVAGTAVVVDNTDPQNPVVSFTGAGTGSVTSVSVAAANGFLATVTNPTTTPAITLQTGVTGILYGNGTGVAAAVAGNFPTLNQNTTGYAGGVLSIASIADLRLISGSIDKQEINLVGYSADGDGGGGIFFWNSTSTTADNGGTIIAPTGVSTGRWYRLYSGAINVRWFGAYGDNTHDDSTAFQDALTFAIAASWGGTNTGGGVFIPAGEYLITKSLNATAASTSGAHAITIEGENTYSSVIYSTLTEAYPVLDVAGNKNTYLSNFSIRQNSGCLATCGILRAYVTSDGVGALGVDTNLMVNMLTAPALVNETDQYHCKDCYFVGTYGAVSGCFATGRLSITSKFQTIYASSDMSYQHFEDTIFLGGTPLWLCGSYDSYLDMVYAAPTFATAAYSGGSAAVVIDSSYSTLCTTGNVHGTLRTENQTASGGQNAIACILVASSVLTQTTAVEKLDLIGAFENTNASGANSSSSILKSDSNSIIQKIRLKGTTGYNTYGVLSLAGSCANTSYDIDIFNTTNLGTVAGLTTGEVRLGQNFTQTDFNTLSAHSNGVVTSNTNSLATQALSNYAFIPGAPAITNIGMAGVYSLGGFPLTAYTAGSGYNTIGTLTVPAGMLTMRSGLQRTAYIRVLLKFNYATTSLQIQTSNNSLTNTFTFGTPLMPTGDAVLEIYLNNNSTSAGGLNICAQCQGQVAWGSLNSSTTFADATSINVQISDGTNNSPVSAYYYPLGLYA